MSRGSTLQRFVAVLILSIMGPVLQGSAACGGWSRTPSERMACCQAAAGHCAAISADDCCAGSEQRQNFDSVVMVLVAPEEPTAGLLLPTPPTSRPAALADRQRIGRPDTYLLDSVFLI